MLTRYYGLRQWDENGHPTAEAIHRLQLEQEAQTVAS
jgi:aldehyde:ferredoxin oxidoreductase